MRFKRRGLAHLLEQRAPRDVFRHFEISDLFLRKRDTSLGSARRLLSNQHASHHAIKNSLSLQRMITLRNKRKSQPSLERLDMRIAPTTMSTATAVFAELKMETRNVHRLEMSVATARPGSRREIILQARIAAKEGLIGRQEVRLAIIEAPATGSQNSLPANVSQTLDVIYNAFETNPGGFPANVPSTDGANLVVIQGSNVGIRCTTATPPASTAC